MRTTAELRAIPNAYEQGVTVRGKRRNVPNAWDDIPHGRRGRNDRGKSKRR
jgi:hypothetical protein